MTEIIQQEENREGPEEGIQYEKRPNSFELGLEVNKIYLFKLVCYVW